VLARISAHLLLHDGKNLLEDARWLAVRGHHGHFGDSLGADFRLGVAHQELVEAEHLVVGGLFRNVFAEAGGLLGDRKPETP
jgi:hypothetical protein